MIKIRSVMAKIKILLRLIVVGWVGGVKPDLGFERLVSTSPLM